MTLKRAILLPEELQIDIKSPDRTSRHMYIRSSGCTEVDELHKYQHTHYKSEQKYGILWKRWLKKEVKVLTF